MRATAYGSHFSASTFVAGIELIEFCSKCLLPAEPFVIAYTHN